jgi:hypothetical protein
MAKIKIKSKSTIETKKEDIEITYQDFNGKPTMSLVTDSESKFPTRLSFGVKKAKMIIAKFNEIKAFVEKNDSKEE